jgi:hypothetical protein
MRNGEKGLKAESSKLKVGDRRRNAECGMGKVELEEDEERRRGQDEVMGDWERGRSHSPGFLR